MNQAGKDFQFKYSILNKNEIQCDVKNLAKGLYFLETITSKKIYTTQLIVTS